MKKFFKLLFMVSLIISSCQLFADHDHDDRPGAVIKKCLITTLMHALFPYNFELYKSISSMQSEGYYQILKEVEFNAHVRRLGIYSVYLCDEPKKEINDFSAGLKSMDNLKFDEQIKSEIVALIDAFNKVMEGSIEDESVRIQLPECLRKEPKQMTEVKGFSKQPETVAGKPPSIAPKPTPDIYVNLHLSSSERPPIVHIIQNSSPEQIAETLNPSAQINYPYINPKTGKKPKLNRLFSRFKRRTYNRAPPAYTEYPNGIDR